MNPILYYFFQLIIVSGILYGYYHFFLRNNRFHLYNRFYLLAIIVISVLVPFLNIPLYFSQEERAASVWLQTITVTDVPVVDLPSVGNITEAPVENPVSLTHILYFVYILLCLVALFRIILSIYRIHRLARQYSGKKLDEIYFIDTNEPGTPFSFFNWMFWNREIALDSEKGEQIFRHELYHIRQKHSADIIFAELVTMLLWINPFFHLIKKELRAIHEFLADQYAAEEHKRLDYAELLLMQVLNTRHSLINPFFHNQIKRRIAMLTSSQQPKHQYFRKLMILPLLAFIAFLFAFSYKAKMDQPVITKAEKPFTLLVDAGHGGKDAGATSPDGQYEEAQLTLAIARTIERLAPAYGVTVVMTRSTESYPGNSTTTHDGLKERISIANAIKPDAFLSIHINAADAGSGYQNAKKGIEAWTADKRDDQDGLRLALLMVNELASVYHTNTTMKQRKGSSIYVLDKNPFPSVMIQCGYINNKEDMEFMSNQNNQEKIARKILASVAQYANGLKNIPGMPSDTPKVKKAISYEAKKVTINGDVSRDAATDGTQPGLYIINGKKYTREEFEKKYPGSTIVMEELITTPANNIKAIELYGEIARQGVIEMKIATVKNRAPIETIFDTTFSIKGQRNGKHVPIYIIDGVEISNVELSSIDPNTIEEINVLKDDAAVVLFGERARNGVIIIKSKKNKVPDTAVMPGPGLSGMAQRLIFEKVEVPAAFKGGSPAWEKYLSVNMDKSLPATHGAPAGRYEVKIRFVVDTNGSIRQIKPLTSHGFGMEGHAVHLLASGPKWLPGIQNGKPVPSYTEQSFIFVVGETVKIDFQNLPEVVFVSYTKGTLVPRPAAVPAIHQFPEGRIGEPAWRKFLERNIDANLGADQFKKKGVYKVLLVITVNEHGKITQVLPFDGKTSLIADYCESVLKQLPSIGQKAAAFTRYVQPMTFVVENN